MRIAIITAMILQATPALADADSAQKTFETGRQLLKQGKYAEACAAFEQSLADDFQYGTLYNLAGCDEHLGKLGSAWQGYHRLAGEDTNAGRRAHSKDLADELWSRVPKLVIKLARTAPAGLAVTLDGRDVTSGIASELPVDPGSHTVIAQAPGFHEWNVTAPVGSGAMVVNVNVYLEPADAPVKAIAEGSVTVTRHRVGPRGAARIFLYTGLGLMATSTVIAVYYKHVYDQNASNVTDLTAVDNANRAAHIERYVATPIFLAGLVCMPVAFYLFSKSDTVIVTPLATTSTAGVSLSGRF